MHKFTRDDIKLIQDKFTSSSISIYSGQTAFFMILSFFPFMLFFFSLLNLTPLSEADFLAWTEPLIPESFHNIMLSFTQDIYKSSSGRISVTIISALWLSSKALVSMQLGLDSMYGIKENRNAVLLRIWAILYSAVFAVILLAILGMMVFGKTLRNNLFAGIHLFDWLMQYRYLLVIPVLFLFLWLSYTILPSGRRKFRKQIPGALFASIGWIAFSGLFSIYVNNYCKYDSIYGTMTTIILIMVWLYGCMYVIFLGGLLNNIIMGRRMVKAVIFDLDGTLIDTEKYYMKAWPEAMAKFGYKLSYEDALSLRSLGRPYAPEHLAKLSGDPDFDYHKVREYRKELMETYLKENGIKLKPFAKEILVNLRKQGVTTALATANDYERTERYLKQIGLFDYFDHILCATMVEKGKPAPDLYAYAVKELNLVPTDCLAVEDSPNGVTSASEAGIPTIMIPDLTEPDEELKAKIYKCYPNLKKFYYDNF